MADAVGNEVFIYMGGDQEVPNGVVRAVIHPSVKIILEKAFSERLQLVSVIFHAGVEIIEREAFYNCESLRRGIKLLGVRDVGEFASLDACPDGCGIW